MPLDMLRDLEFPKFLARLVEGDSGNRSPNFPVSDQIGERDSKYRSKIGI